VLRIIGRAKINGVDVYLASYLSSVSRFLELTGD
jgi:hypothetical protein